MRRAPGWPHGLQIALLRARSSCDVRRSICKKACGAFVVLVTCKSMSLRRSARQASRGRRARRAAASACGRLQARIAVIDRNSKRDGKTALELPLRAEGAAFVHPKSGVGGQPQPARRPTRLVGFFGAGRLGLVRTFVCGRLRRARLADRRLTCCLRARGGEREHARRHCKDNNA
jgi:hypothetical protein